MLSSLITSLMSCFVSLVCEQCINRPSVKIYAEFLSKTDDVERHI